MIQQSVSLEYETSSELKVFKAFELIKVIPDYRGTSLIRNCRPLGPYSRTVPRALRWSWGRGGFL